MVSICTHGLSGAPFVPKKDYNRRRATECLPAGPQDWEVESSEERKDMVHVLGLSPQET